MPKNVSVTSGPLNDLGVADALARNLTRVHVLWCDEPQTRALLPSGPSPSQNSEVQNSARTIR
jgi:hypothetical protein